MKRFSLAIALILCTANGLFAQPPANVLTSKVEQRELREGQSFVGTVIPVRSSEVGSAVDGRVVEFPIHLGKRVKKDEPLAQLLTSQLDIELKAAQAELVALQAQLAEAQHARPEDILRAEAQLAAKKSAYEFSSGRLSRMRKTVGTQAFTEDQVDEIQSNAVQAYQMYNDANAALEMAKKGARDELKAQYQARVAAQEQEVARIQDQLNKHTIRAPFNGFVVAENTEAGQWLARGGMVAKIIDLDQVDVEIAVLESYLPNIALDTDATVEITSLPDRRFAGKVREINPLGDQRTRNFTVRIRIENNMSADDVPVLKAGMFARATISAGKTTNAMVVPKDAVVLGDPQGPKVFIVAPSPMNPAAQAAMPVYVQLGAALGGMFEVKGNLQPGMDVVVQGNERLFPGQPVVPKSSQK